MNCTYKVEYERRGILRFAQNDEERQNDEEGQNDGDFPILDKAQSKWIVLNILAGGLRQLF